MAELVRELSDRVSENEQATEQKLDQLGNKLDHLVHLLLEHKIEERHLRSGRRLFDERRPWRADVKHAE